MRVDDGDPPLSYHSDFKREELELSLLPAASQWQESSCPMHRSTILIASFLSLEMSCRLRQNPNLGRIMIPLFSRRTLHPWQLSNSQLSLILLMVKSTQPLAPQVIFSLIWSHSPLKDMRGALARILPSFYNCIKARAVKVRFGFPTLVPSSLIWWRWQNWQFAVKSLSRNSFQAQVKVIPLSPCIQPGEDVCTDVSHLWRLQSPLHRSPSWQSLLTCRVYRNTFRLRMGSNSVVMWFTLSSQLSEFSMAALPKTPFNSAYGS